MGEKFFLSPLHRKILASFENTKNEHKKAGNLFLISCLGTPFYVKAVIRFLNGNNSYEEEFIYKTQHNQLLLGGLQLGHPSLLTHYMQ